LALNQVLAKVKILDRVRCFPEVGIDQEEADQEADEKKQPGQFSSFSAHATIYTMRVSVFGNPDLDQDSLVTRLVPRLRKRFPEIEFKVEDPSEGLRPPAGAWVILDVAQGIKGVKLIKNIDQLTAARRLSLHDYDLAMELKLLGKLGKLKKLKIIGVEMGMNEDLAFKAVSSLL
jgi:hypothetical protein